MSECRHWDAERAARIVDELTPLEGAMLPILHAMNHAFGCVPEEATALIAEKLNLSRAEVHGVISFYHDFRRTPAGKVVVKICRAEACQAQGGVAAADALLKRLGVGWGETTADGALTIEPVYCLGLCSVAPAAFVGDKPVARFDGAALIARVEAPR